MNRKKTIRKAGAALFLAAVLTVSLSAELVAVPAFASDEEAAAEYTMPGVTLQENSSYYTDPYFGVLNVSVDDNSVAYASADSKNRVIVTAVGTGSTKVRFWYRASANGDWIGTVLPLTVSGKADTAQSLSLSQAGVVFPGTSVSLSRGQSYSFSGLKLNGDPVEASALLWVSSNDSVASVGQKTGELSALKSGTATLFAIDPLTGSCSGIPVTVS